MKEEPAMGKCPGRAVQAQETGQEEIPKQARACLGPSVLENKGKDEQERKGWRSWPDVFIQEALYGWILF